jgi:hypothetical protein
MEKTKAEIIIPTRYKGYSFRSRLEARWAVFFDELGIEWEYEKEGFNLGAGLYYLPDFWLPQVNMWAEVKPDLLLPMEREKAQKLCEQTHQSILFLIGIPEDKPYKGLEFDISSGRIIERNFCLTMYHNYPINEGRFYCEPSEYDSHWKDTARASISAKSARFEWGAR